MHSCGQPVLGPVLQTEQPCRHFESEQEGELERRARKEALTCLHSHPISESFLTDGHALHRRRIHRLDEHQVLQLAIVVLFKAVGQALRSLVGGLIQRS